MSDSDALIHAVQSALKTTERHAHRIIDLSSRLLAIARQYDLAGSTEVRSGFLQTWGDLCGAFRDFWTCYASRSQAGTFIPGQFRPHAFLACVATTSEVNGIVGRSLCHIAFKYGLDVRHQLRRVVPRGATGPVTPTTDPQPLITVQLDDAPPGTQGGFGFPIIDESIPGVQAALRAFVAWDHTTVERVKVSITQEVGRGWLQVPVTIRAMSAQRQGSDKNEPSAGSGEKTLGTVPDSIVVEGNGAGPPVAPGSPLPAGTAPPADLQAARDAVVALVRCLDDRVKSFRNELHSGPKVGIPRRENLVAAVEELGPLIADADERLAPIRVELQDVRGMIPSVHEEVIAFARNFRTSAESLTAAGAQPDKTAVQVWLAQASMSVDGFRGGIVNPRFHHATKSGIDFEMTQAALRRARNGGLSSQEAPARGEVDLPVRPDADRNPTAPRYTLGNLITALDGVERDRTFSPIRYQERAQRDSLWAHMARTYESALAWRPDERQMPGISRIELLCDLEPGEAGINAAKVRRLRARICQRQHWQPHHADELTLNQAADILEEIQRVSLDEFAQAGLDMLHHGLATLDTIGVGVSEEVQVTGLSCKVIAGTTPTACPDAKPVLPPSMLPRAERAIRRLYPLPAGTTVHWVGHDTGVRSRCRCHPNAPFAAPFDRHRWEGVAMTSMNEQVVSDVTARLTDASRCPECQTPPNPLDVAAGGTVRCRGCGLWELATGKCLLPIAGDSANPTIAAQLHAPYWRRTKPNPSSKADAKGQAGKQRDSEGDDEVLQHPNGTSIAMNGTPPVADPVIDETELSVLTVLKDRFHLLKNVDIEAAANLSKQKVGKVIADLIAKHLVHRPEGERKGATLTPEGIALMDRIRKSSPNHP